MSENGERCVAVPWDFEKAHKVPTTARCDWGWQACTFSRLGYDVHGTVAYRFFAVKIGRH